MKAQMNEGEVDDLDILLGQLEDYAFLGNDDGGSQLDQHSKNTATYRDRSPTREYADINLLDNGDTDIQLLQYRSESREELKAGYNNEMMNKEHRHALPDEDVKNGSFGQDNQEIKFNDILQWVWSTQQQLQTVHLGEVSSVTTGTASYPQYPTQMQASWQTEPISPPTSNLMLPPAEPRSYSSARSDRSNTSLATIPSASDYSNATLPSQPPSISSFTLSERLSRPPSEKTSRPSSRRASPVRSRATSRASSPKFSRNNSPRRGTSTKSPRQISSRGSSPCKRRSSGYEGATPKPTAADSRPSSTGYSTDVIDVRASSSTDAKPSSSAEVTPAKLPRYKRPSHINAEYKRRGKIKKGFEDLLGLVPTINTNGKDTKTIMLTKCTDYLRAMKTDCKRYNKDVEALKAEIEELNVQVGKFQEELPESGADGILPRSEVDAASMDDMFNEYVERETKSNWKFWIFSLIVRPLFESYKVFVSGEIRNETFYDAVNDWVKKHCSLTNLRPGALKSLRYLCKVSSVMTDPEKLPDEAMNAVVKNRGAATTHISDKKS
ncbi:MLX-interacting protein-like [Lineus longissimus]|uniref:MLX-interacting protein-like n=1 Tax=Lineus longissimus TaxID=88925 RepID=UPI002B4D58C3